MPELDIETLQLGNFAAFTTGVIVLFVGKRVNDAVGFLREFSIPEPVTGGLLFAIASWLIYAFADLAIQFELETRDLLLVYFFTTIGINASVKDLLAGGKPLVILLVITITYMFVQNIVGITVATLLGQPAVLGLLGGTVSLIGGHGTAIAWSPRIAEQFGLANAVEIGIACATFGLILASLMGGPIAKYLINRDKLERDSTEPHNVGRAVGDEKVEIDYLGFLDALLAIHLCIILGVVLNDLVARLGLDLPLFVTCLFAGILVTNLMPASFPRFSGRKWPSRTPAIALIADVSLGTFLAMSLMSMQLWALVDLAGPILAILSAQFIIAVSIALFLVYWAIGRNYDAAVVSAGFGGISLGSTPVAMANMSAVTTRYGPSHLAFIIVPLVCAFFIDLANALIIPFFMGVI